ncbi:ThuA domain-containing protein [Planctomycetota bacterium]
MFSQNVNPSHPITRGLPAQWAHPQDEVYYNMRGPAENITVLATAFSDSHTRGSGKDQPILFTVDYGQGRVFHDMLGHDERAYRGLGYQTTLLRGTEWVATGKVSFAPVSAAVLTSDKIATREPNDVPTITP